MNTLFKPGTTVRVKGAEPVGTIESNTEGYVSVRYDHRPGISTFGYYPQAHLEIVTPPTDSPNVERSEPEPKVRPKAKASDILPPSTPATTPA